MLPLFSETKTLSSLERFVFSLRELYSSYGYSHYCMSKFEEYDVYSRNKDFLVSDAVITFTDTNGKLMALKPDVTLSIVKNDCDDVGSVRKVYYDENVYRVSKGNDTFREIKQTGLECIGAIDTYQLAQVMLLAAKSLKEIADDFVLVISDLDILLSFVDGVCSDPVCKRELIKRVGEKNAHGLDELGERYSLDLDRLVLLKKLISSYGSPKDVIEVVRSLSDSPDVTKKIDSLADTLAIFEGTGFEKNIQLDFSTVGDFNYYNGVVFKGFVAGVPDSVLSGGQYDRLMVKLGRRSRAAGFAVYLDRLDRLGSSFCEYDADVMLVYGENDDVGTVRAAVESFISDGKSVAAVRGIDASIKCREVYELSDGEVKKYEQIS